MKYFINLIGLSRGEEAGDVLDRQGKCLGTWRLETGPTNFLGRLAFCPKDRSSPTVTRDVWLDSGDVLAGLAITDFCDDVLKWRSDTLRSNSTYTSIDVIS